MSQSLPVQPSLSSSTAFTTTTSTISSSSSSSSTTITPATFHTQLKYFPTPIARPKSNMSISTNSTSKSATSPSPSVSAASIDTTSQPPLSVPLHLSSAHIRDFSAPAPIIRASSPQSAALRVSQSQSHIRSSSAGVDNGMNSGNTLNYISNISTAASPVFSPFVSPQLDSNEGGTNSPVLDSRPSHQHQSYPQPFSPRLLSFLRSQSQEHERDSSAGSVMSSSSAGTKAYSSTSSSAGSLSSVEIISNSNDASVNNISSLITSASTSVNNLGQGFTYATELVFGINGVYLWLPL